MKPGAPVIGQIARFADEYGQCAGPAWFGTLYLHLRRGPCVPDAP